MEKLPADNHVQSLLGEHRICPGVRVFFNRSRRAGQNPSLAQIQAMDKRQAEQFLFDTIKRYEKFASRVTGLTLCALLVGALGMNIPLWGWGVVLAASWAWLSLSRVFWGTTEIEQYPDYIMELLDDTPRAALYKLRHHRVDRVRWIHNMDLAVVFLSQPYICADKAQRLTKLVKRAVCQRNNNPEQDTENSKRRVM